MPRARGASNALSLVALIGCCFDALRISAALPGVALAAAAEYAAGLVLLARRATAARISRVLGGISHDRLTRLREQDRFSVPSLVLAFIKVVHALGVRGWLCLDDTCIPHERSRKMRGVYWDYDHSLGRNVLGTRIVGLPLRESRERQRHGRENACASACLCPGSHVAERCNARDRIAGLGGATTRSSLRFIEQIEEGTQGTGGPRDEAKRVALSRDPGRGRARHGTIQAPRHRRRRIP